MRLEDKVAVVTGAGSGIGRATALGFAEKGARVVPVDRSTGRSGLSNTAAVRWSAQWIASALPVLALAGCSTLGQPPPLAAEPFTALYVVKAGPYPLYEQAQDRISPADGPWLHSGCIFDVQRTSPDQQDARYVWGYGRVFRCDDVVATGVTEPQMGIRPRELRIYDGWVGYFPMRLLDPYTGSPPAPRQ